MDFRAGLYILVKRKISFPCQGSEVCSLITHPSISHCPDELSKVSHTTVNNGL